MLLVWLLALQTSFLSSTGFQTRTTFGWIVGERCSRLTRTFAAEAELPSIDVCQVPLTIHHTALKTRNITLAIEFYGLFGFEPTRKFRAGPARAAWLEQKGTINSRIEIIEVPSFMLNESEGMKRRALDLAQKQELLGLNHLALDVTNSIQSLGLSNLSDWLKLLNEKSVNTFGKTMRVALEPQQQLIGNSAYELAFLYDADGALLELLYKQKDLPQTIDSGWEPWDGQNFVGLKQ
jgi:catechol 2,3-dioxygenase-like lactoylglutathione lyase family enzyme